MSLNPNSINQSPKIDLGFYWIFGISVKVTPIMNKRRGSYQNRTLCEIGTTAEQGKFLRNVKALKTLNCKVILNDSVAWNWVFYEVEYRGHPSRY